MFELDLALFLGTQERPCIHRKLYRKGYLYSSVSSHAILIYQAWYSLTFICTLQVSSLLCFKEKFCYPSALKLLVVSSNTAVQVVTTKPLIQIPRPMHENLGMRLREHEYQLTIRNMVILFISLYTNLPGSHSLWTSFGLLCISCVLLKWTFLCLRQRTPIDVANERGHVKIAEYLQGEVSICYHEKISTASSPDSKAQYPLY